MKKFRNFAIIISIFIVSAIFSINVFGETQSFSMSASGPSTAIKGSNITLTFTASDLGSIRNGFAGYEGYINYDSSKLEFESATNIVNGWVIYTNKLSNKIKFMGYDDNPPNNSKNSDTQIFKATFKVLQTAATGETTLTMDTIKGSTGSGSKIIANNFTKSISIEDPVPIKSSNSNLGSLVVSEGSLSPAFNSNTTSYSISVPNGTTKVDVSAVAADPNATVIVRGNDNLLVGKNNILVEVTAEDGSKKVYTIEVSRASAASTPSNQTPTKPSTPSSNQPTTSSKSPNANLKSISGIPGLDFNPDKTTYDVAVPFEITDLNVSAIAADSKAKVNITNATLKNMEVGKTNTVTIAVTSEDSSVKIYTINVKRSEYSSETDLKQLTVNGKDLLIQNTDNGEYKITVDRDTDKLDISAIPMSEGSKVKIIGNENLKPGKNSVIIEVTDRNGFTKSYAIDVEKESDNAFISFFKNYWILLLLGLLILLLIILIIYLNRNNKTIIYNNNTRIIDNKKLPYADKKQLGLDDNIIDNDEDILYNSNDNSKIIGDVYSPRHADEDTMIAKNNSMNLDNIMKDEDVSRVKKEVTIVKDELHGDDLLEKEYTITENYRKK